MGGLVDLAEGDARSAAIRAQSSYSGLNVGGRPSSQPSLPLTVPNGVVDLGGPALQLVPADRVAADAQRGRLAEQDLLHRRDLGLVAEHGDHHAGPVLLHLDRRHEGVEGPGLHQLERRVADDLAGQVVEVGLEHPDAVAATAGRSTFPTNRRRMFAWSAVSRSPRPGRSIRPSSPAAGRTARRRS